MAAPSFRRFCRLLGNTSSYQHSKKHTSICLRALNSGSFFTSERVRPLCSTTTTTTTTDGPVDVRDVREKYRKLEKLFASSEVQNLLHRMTGFDLEKIFKPVQKPLRRPVYKFMTDEELKQAREKAAEKGRQKLQMPPYIRYVEKAPTVLSKDQEIQGLISNNLVCVDITPGLTRRTRSIVVRQPDGLLRESTYDERNRTNQVYYPIIGREVLVPSMFKSEHLKEVLQTQEYVFILDRACIQFETYDSDYIRVTETTYQDIDTKKNYDILRSTRHFGPMAFYLVLEDKIEGLMVDMIHRLLVADAVDLVELYFRVHKPERWEELKTLEDPKEILKVFASEDYKGSGKLQLVVQSLYEMEEKEQAVN